MSVLVTGATGMFGGLIVEKLSQGDVPVLAASRSESRAASLTDGSVTGVVADMDKPETFVPLLQQVDRMFLVSPMHPDLGERECALIECAKQANLKQVVKLYGSVEHEGDPLDLQHWMAIDALKASGLSWCLVSPQTVTDSHVMAQLETIRSERRLYACAGDGRMGMVTADNCAEVAALVLQEPVERFAGRNLQITGPEAITYAQVAQQMSSALGENIEYIDMTEEELARAAVEAGMPEEDLELQVLCHFRQIRNGKAELVTDTYREVVGRPATSVHDWTCANRMFFE
ncbi:MAG: hypothetical protein CMJ40_04980 [Phycisphaerae bacterium]|nr:hypothetical protein [Phycisphaerae bacterium]